MERERKNKVKPEPAMVTVNDAATMIGFSRRWLQMRIQSGEAPVIRIGPRTLRFRRADVEVFSRSGKWPKR